MVATELPSPDDAPESPGTPVWQVPSLATDDRILGGVAAGIAREIGLDPLWIRLAFVMLFASGGWGALLYFVSWGALAQVNYLGRGAKHPRQPKARSGRGRIVGVGLITIGLLVFFVNRNGMDARIVWPLGVLVVGFIIVMRQVRPGDLGGRYGLARALGGVVVLIGGVFLVMGGIFGFSSGETGVWVGVGVAVGLVFLSAPWWWRMVQDLDQERQARIRSDERAEVAAHIHDSVLQTLTLIQRNDDDPRVMRNLARRQERELRNWLDPDRADRSGGSVRGQLDEMATELEELHGVPLEVVVVGDCLVTPSVAAALAAAREAAVNSAKHSGAEQIDVYVEIGEAEVEIFVRDTGAGFDPEQVAEDRRGIKESIEGRMRRAGGEGRIFSEPGAGTEVEMRVPRPRENDAIPGQESQQT